MSDPSVGGTRYLYWPEGWCLAGVGDVALPPSVRTVAPPSDVLRQDPRGPEAEAAGLRLPQNPTHTPELDAQAIQTLDKRERTNREVA